ncbi:hypothetical protein D7B24_000285 [Verticillium nonalfalfae]|uniref:Stress-response A/B barrel domain-containing protein n=1 Tax=Verticillium nonalfalfae TaxID=1051616 RepID=A0A3M9YI15_9PEZI|nr:uncharacterized protein D7B24_000285 [Verticillium nonalfalfae]RNJ60089.1 hypothetical protein D7B24_000285 [Verticillium nonalfalfae]
MLPRGLKSVILVVVLLLIALGVYLSPLQVHVPYDLLPSIAMGPITHLVLFQFKEDASSSAIRDATARMLQLKDNCVHPTSGTPYIVSAKGGKDNSPEGLQGGITHAFVVEFSSASDRDYYVKEDPVHKAFVKSIEGLVTKAVVVDFADGVY